MIELLLVVSVCIGIGLCLHDPRAGLLLTMLAGFAQEPLRKVVPGEPLYLTVLAVIFVAATLTGLWMRGAPLNLRMLYAHNPLLRTPLLAFIGLVLIQSMIAFVKTGNPVIAGIGLLAYLTPFATILLGYYLMRSEEDFRRYARFYVVACLLMISGVYLSVLGFDWQVLKAVGVGLFAYAPEGGILDLHSGFFRGSELAGWHGAAGICLLILLFVVWKQGWSGKSWFTGLLIMFVVVAIVFTALGGIIRWVWEKVLRPVFGFIGRHWDTLAKGIRWTWRNILWPVIDLLGTAILKGLWYGIIKPTFNLIRGAFEILGAGMKFVWKNVIAPVLNALGFAVSDDLVQAFKDAMGGIRRLWNGLVEIIGRPLRFVIQTILNNGMIAGFNKIAKFVGSDTMGMIPVPKWSMASQGNTGPQPNLNPGRSGVFAATGAVLPGWTPGRDVHHFVSPTGGQLHLSGGEAVMRPEWTKAMGPGYVHYMNRIARMEGVDGIRKRLSGQAYARGGITPAPGSWNRHTSGYPWATWAGDINVPGDSDYGNPVRAYKAGVVAAVQALTGSYGKHIRVNHPDGSQTLYAHLSSMLVSPGQKIDAGQLLGRVGSTGNSSGPHLHFEIKNGHFPVGMEDGSGSGMPGWLEKIIGTPVKWFGSLVENGIDKAVDLFGGSPLLDLAAGVGKKLVGGLVDKVLSFFAGGNSDPDSLGIEGDIPNNAVRQTVQAMAKQYGWGRGDQWEALAEIISRESSWDPNAANPSSSARGLFQKMTSLHGALEGTVEGQARWGLDYIRRAYGNPMNALMHHNKHGWYADGGIVGDQAASTGLADNGTMMYDSGGYLPPGLTTVVNLTGKPEPVFTAEQFEAMENGGGGGLTYAPTFNGSDLTAADVADDLEFSFRKLRREGKYAKAGT